MAMAFVNLGEFLTLNRNFLKRTLNRNLFSTLQSKLFSLGKPKINHVLSNTTNNNKNGITESIWQTKLPDDILALVIRHLNVTDFASMRCTCKSWLRASQRLLQYSSSTLGPQHPWLLLPHCHNITSRNYDYRDFYSQDSLTLFDLFEGKFRRLKLPDPVREGWCCGSSCKGGWVPITNRLKLDPDVFLVNPLTGQTIALPPLSTLPGYDQYCTNLAPDPYNASWFVNQFEFSKPSPVAPGCLVAGLFFGFTTIAFFKVGADSWTALGDDVVVVDPNDVVDDDDYRRIIYADILFSADGTTLYAYTLGQSCALGIQTSSISLSFHDQDHVVVFKSIPENFNMKDQLEPLQNKWVGNTYNIGENAGHLGYLLETSNGKLLIVLRVVDIMINVPQDDHENNNNDDDEPPRVVCQYCLTRGFKVFSLDPHNGEVCQLSKLEEPEDVIFVGSGCFSLSSRDFASGFIQGNRIYFLDDASCANDLFDQEVLPYASRETGVFDLNTGKIKRCIPSVHLPMLSQMLWFTPTLM